MKGRNLLCVLRVALGGVGLPAISARALQVTVSVNYIVMSPVTDSVADISYGFDDSFQCLTDSAGLCPGGAGVATLRIDAVPEPSTLLLLASGLAGFAVARRRSRRLNAVAPRIA